MHSWVETDSIERLRDLYYLLILSHLLPRQVDILHDRCRQHHSICSSIKHVYVANRQEKEHQLGQLSCVISLSAVILFREV